MMIDDSVVRVCDIDVLWPDDINWYGDNNGENWW